MEITSRMGSVENVSDWTDELKEPAYFVEEEEGEEEEEREKERKILTCGILAPQLH